MLNLFFQITSVCCGCKGNLNPNDTPPLCSLCRDSLQPAPQLCACCMSHCCFCEFLTRKSAFKSLHARYSLTSRSFTVLKKWKTLGGRPFNRLVFERLTDSLHEYENQIDCIVPIPQRAERSWQLKGSPAERIARKISKQLKKPWIHIPVRQPLIQKKSAFTQDQKTKANEERHESRLNVELDSPFPETLHRTLKTTLKNKRILLVDDFFTTGRTLKNTQEWLIHQGFEISEFHAFALGYRPRLKSIAR